MKTLGYLMAASVVFFFGLGVGVNCDMEAAKEAQRRNSLASNDMTRRHLESSKKRHFLLDFNKKVVDSAKGNLPNACLLKKKLCAIYIWHVPKVLD